MQNRNIAETSARVGIRALLTREFGAKIADNAVIAPELCLTDENNWVFKRGVATFGFYLTNGGYLVSVVVACKDNKWTNQHEAFEIRYFQSETPLYIETTIADLMRKLLAYDRTRPGIIQLVRGDDGRLCGVDGNGQVVLAVVG